LLLVPFYVSRHNRMRGSAWIHHSRVHNGYVKALIQSRNRVEIFREIFKHSPFSSIVFSDCWGGVHFRPVLAKLVSHLNTIAVASLILSIFLWHPKNPLLDDIQTVGQKCTANLKLSQRIFSKL
jgi:hypothetical protein